jgi:hypothetical protein
MLKIMKKEKTMKDCLVDIGDVRYSKLTHTLTFTVACGPETIRLVEDIAHRNDMTPEETATEIQKILHTAIYLNYHRGGRRMKYD